MSEQLKLSETSMVTSDGHTIQLAYEEVGDILEVVFPGVKANCAIELTEHILLSFNREQGQAAGMTILDFSDLVVPTTFGPRSFALSNLENFPVDLQEMITNIITRSPVNHLLTLVSFQTSSGQILPLTYWSRTQAVAVPA